MNKHGSFESKDKFMTCSSVEGIVYNSTVWLSDNDIERAKEVLINHERTEMASLYNKIKHHLRRIKILKGDA
jgi:hypothetical protein